MKLSFEDYKKVFIQRLPRYAVKSVRSGTWKTRNKPLADPAVMAHLKGKYNVAVLGKWYPEFVILDLDDKERSEVDEIISQLELTDNSMIFESESENSYHVLFKSEYKNRPPTLNLIKDVWTNYARSKGIEVYPQAGRPIRLPFGKHQNPIDPQYSGMDWKQLLYWYNKLDPFDLSLIPFHQMMFDFPSEPIKIQLPLEKAEFLFNEGLHCPSSRNESQYKVLYFLWRQNIPQENAVDIVWNWINKKHNGFSRDILIHPKRVYGEIERQANKIWSEYQLQEVYPDSTHNLFHGFITKPDIPDIVEATEGSLPRMKFLFNLVKYSYPRRYRKFISIHTDRLIQWSSHRTYQKYLNEFEKKGIAERKTAYLPGGFSKDLKINWKFRNDTDAVIFAGRTIETFEGTVKRTFQPEDFRQMLEKSGTPRKSRYSIINKIWGAFNPDA